MSEPDGLCVLLHQPTKLVYQMETSPSDDGLAKTIIGLCGQDDLLASLLAMVAATYEAGDRRSLAGTARAVSMVLGSKFLLIRLEEGRASGVTLQFTTVEEARAAIASLNRTENTDPHPVPTSIGT